MYFIRNLYNKYQLSVKIDDLELNEYFKMIEKITKLATFFIFIHKLRKSSISDPIYNLARFQHNLTGYSIDIKVKNDCGILLFWILSIWY